MSSNFWLFVACAHNPPSVVCDIFYLKKGNVYVFSAVLEIIDTTHILSNESLYLRSNVDLAFHPINFSLSLYYNIIPHQNICTWKKSHSHKKSQNIQLFRPAFDSWQCFLRFAKTTLMLAASSVLVQHVIRLHII